jgi:hypothetical protein
MDARPEADRSTRFRARAPWPRSGVAAVSSASAHHSIFPQWLLTVGSARIQLARIEGVGLALHRRPVARVRRSCFRPNGVISSS